MELVEKIGNFIQLADIPSNGLMRQSMYGYITVDLLNTMYSTCLSITKGVPADVSSVPPELQYKDMEDALKGFKILNVVDDIDKAVCANIQKGITKPVRVHVDLTEYIRLFANKYLRFRRQQLDCDYIITALDSELYIFSEGVGLNMNIPYTSSTTFRSTQLNRRNYIFNEVMALKRLKELLAETYGRIKELTFKLQELSLSFRSQIVNNREMVDLEL